MQMEKLRPRVAARRLLLALPEPVPGRRLCLDRQCLTVVA